MTAGQAFNLTDNERNNLGNPTVFSLIEQGALSVTQTRGLTLEHTLITLFFDFLYFPGNF